jgi:hypothetical protein
MRTSTTKRGTQLILYRKHQTGGFDLLFQTQLQVGNTGIRQQERDKLQTSKDADSCEELPPLFIPCQKQWLNHTFYQIGRPSPIQLFESFENIEIK